MRWIRTWWDWFGWSGNHLDPAVSGVLFMMQMAVFLIIVEPPIIWGATYIFGPWYHWWLG